MPEPGRSSFRARLPTATDTVTTTRPVLLAGGGWAGDRYTHFDGVRIANPFASLLQHFGLEDSTFGDNGDAPLGCIR